MTVVNVYLSIVNDRSASDYLRGVVRERGVRGKQLYSYSQQAFRHASTKAGVEADARLLSTEGRVDAWQKIIDYMFDVDLDTHPDYNPQLKEKEEYMTISVETKHFVGNQDVSTMTGADLIEVIKKLEKEIADLKAVNSESKFIEGKVKELQITLKDVVKHLDSKL